VLDGHAFGGGVGGLEEAGICMVCFLGPLFWGCELVWLSFVDESPHWISIKSFPKILSNKLPSSDYEAKTP